MVWLQLNQVDKQLELDVELDSWLHLQLLVDSCRWLLNDNPVP